MIRKPRKNQIIKKVFLEEGFVDRSNFYFPIEVSNIDAKSFAVNRFCITIIPQYFIIPNSNENLSNVEIEYNQSYRYQDKPFFLKEYSKNTVKLSKDNLEDNFKLQNDLYSKIYANNLVSSYGQQSFLEDTISYFPSNNNSNKFLLSVDINKINEATSSIIEVTAGIESVYYYDFLVKVYALNDADELIDFVNIKSKNITDYPELDSNNDNINLLRQQTLNLFVESFVLSFVPYRFPVLERLSVNDLGGVFFNFNRNFLLQIFEEEQNESVIISAFFENNESDYFELINASRENLQEINDNFIEKIPYNLITSEDFFKFINSANQYITRNNIDNILLNLTFTIVNSNGNNITLSKDRNVDRNTILQTNEDLLKYSLQKNITNQQVISFKLTRQQLINSNNLYKLDIALNNNNFLIDDIINGRLNFTFMTLGGFDYKPTTFYFDSQLTEDNLVLIDSTKKISNYMFNTNKITIYFSTELNIGSFFAKYFKDDLNEFFPIGPIETENSSGSFTRINENIYDEAVDQIADNIICNVDSRSYVFNSFQNVRNLTEDFIIDVSSILRNINYVNLGYFNNDNISTEESLREITNNIIVKFNKKILVNGFNIFEEKNYDILNNTILSTNFNTQEETYKVKIRNSFLERPLDRIDIVNELSNNQLLLDDIKSFQALDFENIKSEFNVSIEDSLSFIIMKNNTVSKFGNAENITQSKNNLIDFIIENSSNFEVSTMENLLTFLYDTTFFSDKNRYLKTIFRLSGLDNKKDFVNISNAKKSDFTSSDANSSIDVFASNLFKHENVVNVLYESDVQCQNTLNLDVVKNNLSFVSVSSIEENFQITGSIINKFIEVYKEDRSASFISEAYIYPIFAFDKNITSLSKNKRYIEESGFLTYSNNNDVYLGYSKSMLSNFAKILKIRIENNRLLSSFYKNEVFFESINNEFYHITSSMIRQNNESGTSNNLESFIIKDILLRICIVINIFGKKYLVVKNVNLKYSPQFNSLINSFSINLTPGNINIDLLDENTEVYMPNLSYKGLSYKWLL